MTNKFTIPLHGCRSLFAGITSRLGDGFCFMTEKTFWENADKSNGENSCWNWQRAKFDERGYGSAVFNGKQWRAHRLAYKLKFGDFNLSLKVCHRCDNPSCVNPAHLFLGTDGDNIRDCVKKGRWNPSRGQLNGSSKLNESDILKIRESKGVVSCRKLAKMFGVCFQTVIRIQQKKSWAHLAAIVLISAISASAQIKPIINYERLADAIRIHENSRKFEYGCEHRVSGKLIGYPESTARAICIKLCRNTYSHWDGKGDYFQSLNKIYAADTNWWRDVENKYNKQTKRK